MCIFKVISSFVFVLKKKTKNSNFYKYFIKQIKIIINDEFRPTNRLTVIYAVF